MHRPFLGMDVFPVYFLMVTGVPGCMYEYRSTTSSFFKAMQPLVQFLYRSIINSSRGQVPCMPMPPPGVAFRGYFAALLAHIKFVQAFLGRVIQCNKMAPFAMGPFGSNL